MAVDGLITSARVTSIMRRVNQLEHLWSVTPDLTGAVYAQASGVNGVILGMTIDLDGYLYYIENDGATGNKTLRKTAYPLTGSSSQIVASSSGPSGINGINQFFNDICCDGTYVYVACTYAPSALTSVGYIKKFSLTGTQVDEISFNLGAYRNSEYVSVSILSDGSLVYATKTTTVFPGTGTDYIKVYVSDNDFTNETEILSFDPTTTTTGEVYDLDAGSLYGLSDNEEFFVTVYEYNTSPAQECRIYDSSGTLVTTFAKPTTGNSTAGTAPDSFNRFARKTPDGRIIAFAQLASTTARLSVFSPMGNHIKDDIFGQYTQNGNNTTLFDENSRIYRIANPITADPDYIMSYDIDDTNVTQWYRYPTPLSDTGKVSLGTPDFGVSVPTSSALQGYIPHYYELRDIRNALEAVCVNYKNPATGNAYNLTASSADNIFTVAIDSGQDDWTTPSVTHGEMITDEHWTDIELVLDQLEASELV